MVMWVLKVFRQTDATVNSTWCCQLSWCLLQVLRYVFPLVELSDYTRISALISLTKKKAWLLKSWKTQPLKIQQQKTNKKNSKVSFLRKTSWFLNRSHDFLEALTHDFWPFWAGNTAFTHSNHQRAVSEIPQVSLLHTPAKVREQTLKWWVAERKIWAAQISIGFQDNSRKRKEQGSSFRETECFSMKCGIDECTNDTQQMIKEVWTRQHFRVRGGSWAYFILCISIAPSIWVSQSTLQTWIG